MAVNKDSKKITSLSLAATKVMGESIRAWFAVAVGKNFLFYIDKKVTDPTKFKDPLKIKKILVQLKIDEAKEIKKDSAVAAGTIKSIGDGYEMTVKVKANGGGKSTLKALIKDATVKRIVGRVDIVKNHDGVKDSDDEKLDQEIENDLKNAKIKGVKTTKDSSGKDTVEIPKELKDALKIYKWWDKEGRDALANIYRSPTSLENQDLLQTLSRRLKKYYKKSMYDLFTDGFFADGALKKLRPKNYDLTKSELKKNIKLIDKLIDNVRNLDQHDGIEEDARVIAEEVEDSAEKYGELEDIAKRLKLKEKLYLDFMEAGKDNIPLIKNLVSKFSNDDVKLLLKHMGHGSWDQLFIQIAMTN